AEASRVGQAQYARRAAAALQGDVDVVVRAGRSVGRQHPQAAGHAQVEQGAAGAGVEQQVLGAPAHGVDALPRQVSPDLGRDRPAQVGTAQDDAQHAPALDVRCQAAARGLDFGQFGHGGSVGARGPRRKAWHGPETPGHEARLVRTPAQGWQSPWSRSMMKPDFHPTESMPASLLDFLAGGLVQSGFWGLFAYFLAATQLTIFTVTLFLHRSQTHRGVDFHPVLAHFFRFWCWLTTSMIVKEWVAIHRKHHARCETEEDPHSPMHKGIREVFWKGAELYREARANRADMEQYGRGTPDDWIERRLYTPHANLGPVLMLAINFVLFGAAGVAIWAIQMLWIPFWAAGVVNGLGHWWGYRNFETTDTATNLTPWGVWIGGEELHNNHHAFPSSAKFALRRWEFDIGWVAIKALQKV